MGTSFTILIIDDEPNLRRTLSVILQKAGYQVTSAAGASEALQNLITGAYDLVFLDIRMPEMDGMTLLPKIKALYPEMPVLILTAHATLETAMLAVRQGASDYLLKPIDPGKILARVEEVLSTQKQPVRRREILSQIQDLIKELNVLDRPDESQEQDFRPAPGPVDPSRYLRCGPFTLDLHTRHVRIEERIIPLPPSTFDILVTLIRHSPNPVSYETLLSESMGYTLTRVEAREMARWQIHGLRKVLEPDQRNPQFIITVRDVGYRFVF
jgi:DNA-binding response OmpR family regulator